MIDRTKTERRLDALNAEVRDLLRKNNRTKTETQRVAQIVGTLLPNVRRALAQQRARGRY